MMKPSSKGLGLWNAISILFREFPESILEYTGHAVWWVFHTTLLPLQRSIAVQLRDPETESVLLGT